LLQSRRINCCCLLASSVVLMELTKSIHVDPCTGELPSSSLADKDEDFPTPGHSSVPLKICNVRIEMSHRSFTLAMLESIGIDQIFAKDQRLCKEEEKIGKRHRRPAPGHCQDRTVLARGLKESIGCSAPATLIPSFIDPAGTTTFQPKPTRPIRNRRMATTPTGHSRTPLKASTFRRA